MSARRAWPPSAAVSWRTWAPRSLKWSARSGGDQTRGILKISGNVPIYDINYVLEFYNLNKKGISLDLKKKEGRDILYKLVEKSDVFVCNFRPHALVDLKLEYKDISKIKPQNYLYSPVRLRPARPGKRRRRL